MAVIAGEPQFTVDSRPDAVRQHWGQALNTSHIRTWLIDKTLPTIRLHRLFSVACCRRVEFLMGDFSKLVVSFVEDLADGVAPVYPVESLVTLTASDAAVKAGWPAGRGVAVGDRFDERIPAAAYANFAAACASANYVEGVAVASTGAVLANTGWVQANYLAWDPLGEILAAVHFPGSSFDPVWRTEAVLGLASAIYTSRDFGPMPILADALEEAGCSDDRTLTYLRGPGPFLRGCWILDMVLGKR